MKTFKILGSGCKNCANTAYMIEKKAAALGVQITLEKITDMGEIMGYGVMSTPGVILDDTLVHAGGMPTSAQVAEWVKARRINPSYIQVSSP